MSHPLQALLDAAAFGTFPPADGMIDVFPSPPGRADAIVGFTGHLVVAADVDPDEVHDRLAPGDFSVWLSAATLSWLGERLNSTATTFDSLLVAVGTGAGAPDWLHRIDALDHPRVARASRYRTDMHTYATGDEAGVLIIGRGLCGRWEIGYEVAPHTQARGLGRRLVDAARGLVPEAVPVWAQVAPGNAASLRATTAGGFAPVAAEVLFPRRKE
jgi:hypothetical protein